MGEGTNVGTAFVTIRPDTTGFESQAQTGLAAPVKRVALGIAAVFAANKVKDWLGGMIGEAEEAQRVGKQTEAVIRSTGGAAGVSAKQVEDYSTALSKVSGLDDEVIQSGANMLLTFKNIGSEIFNRTLRATTDMAAGMAAASGGTVDLKGASIQLGKALNDPIAGISALSRVGVQFTEDQKAQIGAMVAAGDTLGAQKVILEEVEKQFSGSAAANATSSMKWRVAVDNLKELIGQALLPVMQKVVDFAQPIVEWLTKNKDVAIALAGVITGVLLVALAAYVVNMTAAAVATLAATWPILAIIAGIAAVAAVAVAFATQWDEIWAWIRDNPVIAAVIALVLSVIAPFLLVAAALGALAANWEAVWAWLQQAASDAWNGVIRPVLDELSGAISWVGTAATDAKDAAASAFTAMGTAITNAYNQFIKPAVDTVIDAINTVKDAWNSFKDAIGGLVSGGSLPTPPGYTQHGTRANRPRASGGPVAAGEWYRVNDGTLRGIEYFRPGVSGAVVPLVPGGGTAAANAGGLHIGTVNLYVDELASPDQVIAVLERLDRERV